MTACAALLSNGRGSHPWLCFPRLPCGLFRPGVSVREEGEIITVAVSVQTPLMPKSLAQQQPQVSASPSMDGCTRFSFYRRRSTLPSFKAARTRSNMKSVIHESAIEAQSHSKHEHSTTWKRGGVAGQRIGYGRGPRCMFFHLLSDCIAFSASCSSFLLSCWQFH